MGAAETLDFVPITETEYLAREREAEEKSEYYEGEVIAMAGTSIPHTIINANLLITVGNALRGKPCRVHTNDLKVKGGKNFMYPDTTIICGKPVVYDERKDVVLNPQVVFEILSPSTERKDRGIKSLAYRKIESLKEYILISQDNKVVEQFTRQDDGTWTLRTLEAGDTLYLSSCNATISVDALYEDAFEGFEIQLSEF